MATRLEPLEFMAITPGNEVGTSYYGNNPGTQETVFETHQKKILAYELVSVILLLSCMVAIFNDI